MSEVIAAVVAAVLYVGSAALIFVFGSSYYALFRTNRSWLFRIGLVGGFAVAAGLSMRSRLDPTYGLLALAFLAAATANLIGAAVAHLQRPLGLRDDTLRGMGIAKGIEAIAVVGTILAILAIGRVPLVSVYLAAGNVPLGLGIGLGGFALFAVLAGGQARQMKIPAATIGRLAPWILLFVLANGFMEEVWLRALFLAPLVPLLGPVAAIGLTAAVFALAHVGASYMSGQERIRFLAILFPLGLAWGAATHFTGSLLASSLFHAGADLIIVNGFVASLHGTRPSATS